MGRGLCKYTKRNCRGEDGETGSDGVLVGGKKQNGYTHTGERDRGRGMAVPHSLAPLGLLSVQVYRVSNLSSSIVRTLRGEYGREPNYDKFEKKQ